MTPNFLLFPEWGKLLFSVADVGIVYLIYAVRLELEKRKPKLAQFCAHSVDSDGNSSDDNDQNCFSTSSIESDSDTNDRNDTVHLNINSKSQTQNQNSYQNNFQNQNDIDNRNHNRRTSNTRRNSKSSKSSIRTSCSVAWLWALNPLAINICTRGSADSLTNCLVLALIYYLMQQSKIFVLLLFDFLCFIFLNLLFLFESLSASLFGFLWILILILIFD
jgi:GPI transamidase subunit PIG-U